MSFFKPFSSQSDGAPLPPPSTHPSTPSNSFHTRLQRLNPFRSQSIYLQDDENYVTSEGGFLELSRWDRMLIFAVTFAGAVLCYLVCIFLFPVLSLKPRKFALLWSLGSIFFLVSFGVLQGFQAYIAHLFSPARLLYTISFITSIVMTLVSCLSLKSTLLSILFAVVQLLAATWYAVSYFPMGQQTLSLASGVARSLVESWINN